MGLILVAAAQKMVATGRWADDSSRYPLLQERGGGGYMKPHQLK